MAKDIVQATNNKGVAGWSLKTDDNATVDPTINWQEGQAPSTVNNSARAMMTRIREEHDLIDNRVKVIENGWGSKFLYVEANNFTLKKNNDGSFDLNMVIKDNLTDEQYADLQARKLLLAVYSYSFNETLDDPTYKSLTTQDIIKLSLSIPTASTTHIWSSRFKLSFFGRGYETNRITLHELAYILNNLMEYVAELTQPSSNSLRTVRAIPMHRSYIDYKIVGARDRGGNEITVKISWYYISPCEIILTMEPSGVRGFSKMGVQSFPYDLGIDSDNLTLLDSTTMQGVVNVLGKSIFTLGSNLTFFSDNENDSSIMFLPLKWDGIRYRFHAKLTTDAHFKLYPMKLYPEPGTKTYPIIA